ncbi:uncharacterized protein LOC128171176 [Crassostrea angulata]|uniref:uncharacterized protein LOC128171176 n=1 Tax=Magallana angulata TaxID=2784310 RepID=UPI0022B0C6C6|nr:uncharacterized protein LOC128171176 [Crassostrea angulata]
MMSSVSPHTSETKHGNGLGISTFNSKIAMIVLGVVCLVVFIAFCTFLGLYIKESRTSIDTDAIRQSGYNAGHSDAGIVYCAGASSPTSCYRCFVHTTESDCNTSTDSCAWVPAATSSAFYCSFIPILIL